MRIIFKKHLWLTVFVFCLYAASLSAQEDMPTINPTAIFTKSDGEQQEGTEYSGPAPLEARFEARAENTGGWTTYYEWRFNLEGESEPYLIRYEEDTNVTFTRAGSHSVRLYAVFTQGNDSVCYTDDYWAENSPISVIISESKLDMPNAFSPNNDDINDEYKAKSYQSLVEFHASIYNRWGQKLYEWDDPSKGWDGTYKGNPVKQGVYFVHVTAKGADGRVYNIRRDVNLLRGYMEKEGGNTAP